MITIGKKWDLSAQYIGKGSPLGNQYAKANMTDEERNLACDNFEQWFQQKVKAQDPIVMAELCRLHEMAKTQDVVLGCYCVPKRCHGETIKRYLDDALSHGPSNSKQPIKPAFSLAAYCDDQILAIEHDKVEKDAVLAQEELVDRYIQVLHRKVMEREPDFEVAFRELDAGIINTGITEAQSDRERAEWLAVKSVKEESLQYNDYDEAVHSFKKQYSHNRIPYKPEDDGVTHINVYSKGKTELGQLLSNFAHTPFKHPVHGHFSSVEAFWYWLSSGQKSDELRSLYGFRAKQAGQLIQAQIKEFGELARKSNPDFEAEIKKAILCKIEQMPKLKELLKLNTLPLTHYYVWGAGDTYRITYPAKYAWIHEYIEDIAAYLHGNAHRLLIAGSREITDTDRIEKYFLGCGVKAIEIVSGMARGVDSCAVEIARRQKLPCAEFPADWDKEGKSAGFIRNERMAQYCSFAIIVWDGKSKGTADMIKRLESYEIPYKLVKFSEPTG